MIWAQVRAEDSVRLLRLFQQETAVLVRHDAGHIVPASSACVARYRAFLERFI